MWVKTRDTRGRRTYRLIRRGFGGAAKKNIRGSPKSTAMRISIPMTMRFCHYITAGRDDDAPVKMRPIIFRPSCPHPPLFGGPSYRDDNVRRGLPRPLFSPRQTRHRSVNVVSSSKILLFSTAADLIISPSAAPLPNTELFCRDNK